MVYVQRTEFETAFDPASPQKRLYASRFFDKNVISYFQWQFLDGEAEILPGITFSKGFPKFSCTIEIIRIYFSTSRKISG